MDKKHIITIAGKLGSGKSSTAKRVSEILGYKYYSTGGMMRNLAKEKNISLGELSLIAENDPSIDKILDDYNLEIGESSDVVLDSRLGFHFIPNSFKVFIELDPETAAKRILLDKKNNLNRNTEADGDFDTEESIAEKVKERLISEKKRYKELYDIEDHTSYKNFDLIINSGNLSLEEVVEKVIKEYQNWLNN